MLSMTKIGKFMIRTAAIFFAAFVTLSAGTTSVSTAGAESTVYTGVLEDLQKDSAFNVNDYPKKAGDYSVTVIQIAESENGELFVYTYQPSKRSTVTDINMSLTEDFDEDAISETVDNAGNAVQVASVTRDISDGSGGFIGGALGGVDDSSAGTVKTKLYHLHLVDRDGVFGKYLVRDFSVSAETTRYYNISSIYREWLKGIDAETGNDNTKSEVALPVGKCFKATTENGDVKYSCEARRVIQILDPYADFLRYFDGFFLKNTACDSHYVAFTTDMRVDELYEADLSYQVRTVHYYHKAFVGGVREYGEWQPQYAFLTDEQEYVKKRTGWLKGSEAKYNRIQSVSEFIKSEDLSDTTKKNLQGKEWVLRFVETDCTFIYDGSDQGNNYWSEVSDVTILRLKFKSAGKVYNLGAVCDKVTGDNIPGNIPTPQKLPTELILWLAGIAVAGVIVGIATKLAKKE